MNIPLYSFACNRICEMLDLGYLKEEPVEVSGGILHHVFQLTTTKSKYAVKALNPKIIQKTSDISKIMLSESVAIIVQENGINALPAISYKGNRVLDIDGRYYLVYPWYDGKAVTPNSINMEKCRVMGALLARIHHTDFSLISKEIKKNDHVNLIDWEKYTAIQNPYAISWENLFMQNISNLHNLQNEAIYSCQQLSNHLVISHRDLLQKNVLWSVADIPMIIDWESAGFINPSLELFDISLFWSGGHKGLPDAQATHCFIKSYMENGGHITEDIDLMIRARFKGKLDWLAYNLKRSLGIHNNDEEEQKLGSMYVMKAIASILHYQEIAPALAKLFSNIIAK